MNGIDVYATIGIWILCVTHIDDWVCIGVWFEKQLYSIIIYRDLHFDYDVKPCGAILILHFIYYVDQDYV